MSFDPNTDVAYQTYLNFSSVLDGNEREKLDEFLVRHYCQQATAGAALSDADLVGTIGQYKNLVSDPFNGDNDANYKAWKQLLNGLSGSNADLALQVFIEYFAFQASQGATVSSSQFQTVAIPAIKASVLSGQRVF